MERRNSTIYTILRSMKKPSRLDEVISSVPKPKGAVPNFGLPKWKSIPLESKIPLIPGPEDAYHFSRRKIGRKLYIASTDAEFDLTDPNHYDITFEYDSLHDRHLARYFSNKKNLSYLKKNGLITETLDAKCSMKEYNMYRKYLQKLHGNSVKRELWRRGEMENEARDLKVANAAAQKDFVKLKTKVKKPEARSRRMNLDRQAAEKRRQQLVKLKKADEQIKNFERKKQEQKERMIIRAKLRAEHAKRRKRRASEKQRQKIIKVLLKWRKRDRERTKRQEECIYKAEEAKRRATEKKWTERARYQEWLLTIEKFILDYADGESKRNIEKYMKKVERERERIQSKNNLKCLLQKIDRRYSVE